MPPPLSIAIGCRTPWPALRETLEALCPQASKIGAEILVAAPPGSFPEDPDLLPAVTRLVDADKTLHQLRALAFSRASAPIVAQTEDHAVPRPGWCEQVLRCHAEQPDAAVIGGVVENVAVDSATDWACFLMGNGAFLAPLQSGDYGSHVPQANSSFKREYLPETYPEFGFVEPVVQGAIRARGGRIMLDERLVVDHRLEMDLRGTCATYYHNGRATAAAWRNLLSPTERRRAVLWSAAAPYRAATGALRILARIAWHKGRHRSEALVATPLIALLLVAHCIGELLGYTVGPGRSPIELR